MSSFGCSYEMTDIEFGYTLSQTLQKGNDLALHLIQSFESGEVDYQKTHKIGKQFINTATKGQREYILVAYTDKGRVHNHIIFCTVNFVNHRKYNSNKGSYHDIRSMNGKLYQKDGLSIVVPDKGNKGESYAEYQAEETGTSWKDKLKATVDTLIPQVSSSEELLIRLQVTGYEIKPGECISCRTSGQERFTRLKVLGTDYTEEAAREQIAGKRIKVAEVPGEQRDVSLLIGIGSSIKVVQSKDYGQWVKICSLKQATKTMNLLTGRRTERYVDLISRIEEVITENKQATDALKNVEKRLAEMTVLIRGVSTYQKTKPVCGACHRTGNREKYRAGQGQTITLCGTTVRPLRVAGIARLPNFAAPQSEYGALQAQKEALYTGYGELKRRVREYDIIEWNIGSTLRADKRSEREKETKRG